MSCCLFQRSKPDNLSGFPKFDLEADYINMTFTIEKILGFIESLTRLEKGKENTEE